MTSLADVFVSGRIDTSKFGPDIKSGMSSSSVRSAATTSSKTLGGHFKSGFGSALRGFAAPITAALGAVAVGSFFKSSFDEATEAQKVGARTANVIKTTGGIANISAKEIGNLSTAISNKVGIDDEAIQSGANLLLTFKNIRDETGKGNDIFNQATQTITDLSVGMDQGLKASAVQVGKALNDPIKGISALSRVGVTFDDQQKKQITRFQEAGRTMAAQKIILKELNSEFGGAAAAAATPAEKAKVAWGNFKESVGTALLPVLGKLATWFTSSALPAVTRFAGFVQKVVVPIVIDFAKKVIRAVGDFKARFSDQITAAVDGARGAFSKFLEIGKEIFDFLKGNRTVVAAFAGTVLVLATGIRVVTIATAAWNAIMDANPIGLVVIALAALVAGLVYAYQNSETFRKIVDETWAAIRSAVIPTIDAIVGSVKTGIGIVTAIWAEFGGFIVTFLRSSFGSVVSVVKGWFKIITGFFQLFSDVIHGNWSQLWGDVKQIVSGAWEAIKGIVGLAWAVIKLQFQVGKELVARAWRAMWDLIKTAASNAWTGLSRIVGNLWDGIYGLFRDGKNLLIDSWNYLWDTAKGVTSDAMSTVWQTIRNAFADIIDLALGFAQTFLNLADKAFGWIPGLGGKLDDAKTAFANFRDDVNAYLRGIEDQHVTVSGSFTVPSQAQISKVTAQLGGLIPAATGGLFTGGTPGKDSIHALVMPNEYINNTKTVAREGVGMFHMLNQGRASIVPHFADGGLVVDAFTDGSGARVTASIADRIMSRVSALLGAGLSRAMDGIVGDLGPPGGGRVTGDFSGKSGIGRGLAWMQSQLGKPYIWGGVGPTGYDCSGLMSALTNIIRGASNPYYRLGSTASMPWPGFASGPGNFSVGWTTNYGGSGIGHTAGTLGGLNVESAGGIGVREGSSARGAFDGGFTSLMHLIGFDRGGLAVGAGWFPKGPAPERVLSGRQTVAFERALDGGFARSGPDTFVLDVPSVGKLTGYIRRAVDAGVQANNARSYARGVAR